MNANANRVRELLESSRGKHGLVLGAGVTGLAVSQLLCSAGYQVTVVDQQSIASQRREQIEETGAALRDKFSGSSPDIDWLLGQGFSFAVLSPGISLDSVLPKAVRKASIAYLSELDLGIAYLGMPEVAVTGTNGKSTTVTLIHEMLLASEVPSELVGNIGKPFVSLIEAQALQDNQSAQHRGSLVAEVSSYQLESAFDFTPQIGVWLNIDDDHLERHETLDEYLRIKARIFSGQNLDRHWSLIHVGDPLAARMRSHAKGRILPFGVGRVCAEGENYCYYDLEKQEVVFALSGSEERYDVSRFPLIGGHNKINLCASIAAARLAGATEQGVQAVIPKCAPLSHRLEIVAERNGILYINDSKATNVSAAAAALTSVRGEFRNANVVLLVGGQKKMGRWDPLATKLQTETKAVVAFGGDRDAIATELKPFFEDISPALSRAAIDWSERESALEQAETLEQAVVRATELAAAGDVVLLAPACASFDAYVSFAARGDDFKRIVQTL